MSGFLLQTFFNNPIAGPFVLGISSGAKLAVALTMIFLLGKAMTAGSGVMIIAAFVRFSDFHGLCPSGLKESKADVHAGGQRRYDRLYLFGCDGFCGNVCRRFQHRKPS